MCTGFDMSTVHVDKNILLIVKALYLSLALFFFSPLRDDEVLPVRTHRIVQQTEEEDKPVKKTGKKESKKGKKTKVPLLRITFEPGQFTAVEPAYKGYCIGHCIS